MANIERISLPQFGKPESLPEISHLEYRQRMEALRARMREAKLDFLIVYGDREHSANIAYLTGFDPRFEEALLLLSADGRRKLLVGNECLGYLPDSRLEIEIELFQDFSLLGQPRDTSRELREILSDFGIGTGSTVGSAGWKYFGDLDSGNNSEGHAQLLEIPGYIVDLLRDLTGDRSRVLNVTSIFMNPRDGLRITNSVDQIAQFEFAASHCSESVLNLLQHIREGVVESDLERFLQSAGLPLSCHRMVGFGAKVKRGLASPSQNRARLGDPFTVALGVQGSLVSRAGAVAHEEKDLPDETREFYPRFVSNYFDVVVEWYSKVKIGANCGDIFAAVQARRDAALYDFAVNPGHYIHLDEWVNSPFWAGSDIILQSGMALQMDIIPVSKGPFCYANAEDGIVLADQSLRDQIASQYPDAWSRIQQRRRFMMEALRIPLDDSVLPLSNIPGWLAPYILEPGLALVHQ